jgi:ATP-binding cassette subfamily F protein uup
MVAQRGHGVQSREAPAAAPKIKAARSSAPAAAATKKKLSFKEQHALEKLPEKIAELERKIATLKKELETPDLFGKNPVRFNDVLSSLEKLQMELAATEETWLTAAMAQEELGR